MGIFDSIQNLIGGVADATQGPIGEIASNIVDIPAVQEAQEFAGYITEATTAVTENAAEAGTAATEQVQSIIENPPFDLGA